jgi:quercetin dioxygenase-like cupin family protein
MPRAADPSPDQPISRAVLLDVRLAQAKHTERVEIREIRILPNHAGGLHIHNCPVVGSIVAGSVTYQIEGQPASKLNPGDVFYEPEGARIARFDATEEGVTFLGYFLLSAGEDPQIDLPDQHNG